MRATTSVQVYSLNRLFPVTRPLAQRPGRALDRRKGSEAGVDEDRSRAFDRAPALLVRRVGRTDDERDRLCRTPADLCEAFGQALQPRARVRPAEHPVLADVRDQQV